VCVGGRINLYVHNGCIHVRAHMYVCIWWVFVCAGIYVYGCVVDVCVSGQICMASICMFTRAFVSAWPNASTRKPEP
jgi:hypothetical protein